MNRDICKEFLEKCCNFKWFIVQYFGETYYDTLVELASCGKNCELYNELNHVWFELPDSIFNICVCPPGWLEFLNLVEE